MKPPVIQRFQKQQYPGSPDWFTRFLSDLNQFTEIMWNIVNNNITPEDNLDSQIYTTQVRAGATAANNAFQFQLNMNHTPTAILVGSVQDTQAYVAPLAGAVGVQWSISGQTVSIQGVSGLTSGHTYNLTLVLI